MKNHNLKKIIQVKYKEYIYKYCNFNYNNVN